MTDCESMPSGNETKRSNIKLDELFHNCGTENNSIKFLLVL